jgi:FixJ family two-component response regulator
MFGRRLAIPEVSLISVVDDDESIRAAMDTLLRSAGHRVETFASAELFLDSGALRETECLILDVYMPGMGGLELQRRLNSAPCGVPIVFLTAHDDGTNRQQAMDAGAVAFLRKPSDPSFLLATVQAALDGQKERRGEGIRSENGPKRMGVP